MTNRVKLCTLLLAGASALPALAQAQPLTPAQQTQNSAGEPVVAPAHPATVEQIHELFKLTHGLDMAHKMMDQMVTGMQQTSAPYLNQSFWDDFRTSLLKIDIESPMVAAYQRYFSEEEMASVIAFYKTPAGQHLLTAAPLVQAASSEQLRSAGQKVGQEVFLRHQKEIEAARVAYEQHLRATQKSAPAK